MDFKVQAARLSIRAKGFLIRLFASQHARKLWARVGALVSLTARDYQRDWATVAVYALPSPLCHVWAADRITRQRNNAQDSAGTLNFDEGGWNFLEFRQGGARPNPP